MIPTCVHPNVRWNNSVSAWECQDCGAYPYSTYQVADYYAQKAKYGDTEPSNPTKVCECGSEKVGSTRHSDYCPKYTKEK